MPRTRPDRHRHAPTPAAEQIDILRLGKLSGDRWPGGLASPPLDLAPIVAGLNNYYIQSDPGAKTRCIDGRHDPLLDEKNLGPQVPGGAPLAALAYRLGVDSDDLTRGTFVNDAEVMIEAYRRLDLSPGGHRDNLDGGGVGCGAIDGLDKVLEYMTAPALVEDHKRLVRALLETDFNRDNYLRVLGAGLVLRSRADGYFHNRGAILDLLEAQEPGSVAVLEGEHQEGIFIINRVPNTTLSSNRFAAAFGVGAFGYDLWRSRQFAQMLLPLPSQAQQREQFITARVMLAIAVMMALTDGSMQTLIRIPVTHAAPPPA